MAPRRRRAGRCYTKKKHFLGFIVEMSYRRLFLILYLSGAARDMKEKVARDRGGARAVRVSSRRMPAHCVGLEREFKEMLHGCLSRFKHECHNEAAIKLVRITSNHRPATKTQIR